MRNRLMEPPRVAFVISRLGIGGAERQLVSLMNSMDRTRFTPVLICLKDIGPMGVDVADDVERIALECHNGSDPRVIARLSHVLRSSGIDIVHCTNFNATFWGRAAAARLDLPAIVAEHSTNRTSRRERLLVRLETACSLGAPVGWSPVLMPKYLF